MQTQGYTDLILPSHMRGSGLNPLHIHSVDFVLGNIEICSWVCKCKKKRENKQLSTNSNIIPSTSL